MARFGSLPFREQIEFFQSKIPAPTSGWADVYGAEHDRAFMVAGIARMDVLDDLKAAVHKAQAEGTGLREFRRQLQESMAEKGWAFPGDFHQRSRLIYRTNLRSSYSAGREAQMADPELRKASPFKVYRSGVHFGSKEPRPEHLSWDGLVLPVDDAWWDTHSPTNGWGCKCKAFLVNQRQMDRLGLKLGKAPPIETRTVTVGQRSGNPRTVTVPKGIDPSFEHRPGATADLGNLAQHYLDRATGLPSPYGAAAVLGAVSRQRVLAALTEQYGAWVDEVLSATAKTNRTAAWGALTPATVRALQGSGVELESAVLLARDAEIRRARRDAKTAVRRAGGAPIALSVEDLKRMPQIAARPLAVLRERGSNSLILVFEPAAGEREAGKLVVRVNFREKVATPQGAEKIVGNFFRSGGYVPLDALRKEIRAGSMQVLEGDL
jgi:hypothetical protein